MGIILLLVEVLAPAFVYPQQNGSTAINMQQVQAIANEGQPVSSPQQNTAIQPLAPAPQLLASNSDDNETPGPPPPPPPPTPSSLELQQSPTNVQPSDITATDTTQLEPGAFPGKDQGRLWNLQDVDIRSVIDEISRETGKNFIVDPRVQGKVTIVSSTPMTINEVYKVFLSTLEVLNYAAVPSGSMIKIIPVSDAKQGNMGFATANNPGSGDQIVVRVISLQNVPADQLAPILRPLVPDWGVLTAYTPANVIIVAGSADNVNKIAQIANRVDTTNSNGIDIIPLHYASAIDVVNTVQSLQQSATAQGAGAGGGPSAINIAYDAANNSVLLGGSQAARLKMKVLISELDTPSASGIGGNTQVISLRYLKAVDLVPILAGVAQSYYRGPVGTIIGTITKTGTDYASIVGDTQPDIATTSTGVTASPQTYQAFQSTQQISPSGTQQAQTTTSAPTGQSQEDKPRIELIAEPATNSIIINAPPTLMAVLRDVIRQLDVRPAEVLVEALIAEVDQSTALKLGIQWGSASITNNQNATTGTNDLTAGFNQGVGIITGKGLHNLAAVLAALQQDKNSNILSTPAVLVLDNHQAKIEVGQQVSIQQSNFPANAAGTAIATPYNTFNRENVTLHLYVTPQINEGNSIQLAIDQGNNTLQNPLDVSTTPIINVSSIKTSILVNSGDIIVLGGLLQNQVSLTRDRLPILGNIPIIGLAFNAHNNSTTKKDLMVFIRPMIVSNPAEGAQITEPRYNFTRGEQLNWMRDEHYYYPLMSQTVLPPLHPVILPHPFPSDEPPLVPVPVEQAVPPAAVVAQPVVVPVPAQAQTQQKQCHKDP